MSSDFHIHHVNLLVDELGPAVAFYRDVLGLPLDPTPDQGFPSQFFRFNDGQQLHMNEMKDARPLRAHFCVVVPDFMAVFHRARAAGALDVEVWGRIRRLPNGKLQMFIRDPSGNLVEIASAPGAPVDPVALDESLFDPAVGNYTVTPGQHRDRQ
jgi:catechol 2,3-dioxygenase-like lactoylglutathione lyase family enzyme